MATTPSDSDLAQLEQKLHDAMIGANTKALDTLLSDDLKYIHSNGRLQSKAEVLSDMKQLQFKEIQTFETRTSSRPGMGVISQALTRTYLDGSKAPSKFRMVYVWIEEGGQWRLLFRQSAPRTD